MNMKEWDKLEYKVVLTNQNIGDILVIANSTIIDMNQIENRKKKKGKELGPQLVEIRRSAKRVYKRFFPLWDYLTSQDYEDDQREGKDKEVLLQQYGIINQ